MKYIYTDYRLNIIFVKNSNWWEANQLAIYGATVKQIQVVRAGLEPGTSGLQVRRPNAASQAYNNKYISYKTCYKTRYRQR